MKDGEGTGNCIGEDTGASDGITDGSALGAGRGTLAGCRLDSSLGWGVPVLGAKAGVSCIDGGTDGDDDVSTDGLKVGSPLGSGNGIQ